MIKAFSMFTGIGGFELGLKKINIEHEVVGFSGGNKYLFPGVAGPQVLNFFHWLGAVITTPKIIGHKWTPVRKVIDRAGAMLKISKIAFCMVVENDGMCGNGSRFIQSKSFKNLTFGGISL